MKKKLGNHWKGLLLSLGLLFLLTGCSEEQKAYEKGMELAKEGSYEEALPYFEQAIGEGADQTEYYIGYGMALNRLGRYEEAKEEFQKVLQDSENKISKENNKQLYYGLSVAEYSLGEYDSVIDYCSKALDISYLDDMDCDILYTRMLAYRQKSDWEKAKADCQEMIEKDSRYEDAYLALAEAENALGNEEEATDAYLALIEKDKTCYDAYFALYDQYLLVGQEAAAEELLDQLCGLNMKKAENMLVVGRAHLLKKNYGYAQECLDMAYRENCVESKYYMGLLHMEQGQYAEAVQAFQSYLEEEKEEPRPETYLWMVQIYMEQEDYAAAQSIFEEEPACGASSVLQELQRTQVVLWELQNEYGKALAAAKEYRRLYPSDKGMKKEIAFIKTRIRGK